MSVQPAIAGIGETVYERSSSVDVKELILEAIEAALHDAGLSAADIDGFATEGAVMPTLMPHDDVARSLGVEEYISLSTSYHGSGIAGAHLVAGSAISSGHASVVVSYFGVDWGSRPSSAYEAAVRQGDPKRTFEKPFGYFGQPVYFAAIANRYRSVFGIDLNPLLGGIALEQRANAVRRESAQMRREMTFDDYLASPLVADPLRIPDCCLLTDGAAATVIVSGDRATGGRQTPVTIAGAALRSKGPNMDSFFSQTQDYLSWPAAPIAVEEALGKAGVALADLDFVELYDCFTMTVVMQLEAIGWCGPGEALDFIDGGKTIALDGSVPLNTHGGLLSHSYLLGMSHIVEAVRQLRHSCDDSQVHDAEVGLVGLLAGPHYGALVLSRDA